MKKWMSGMLAGVIAIAAVPVWMSFESLGEKEAAASAKVAVASAKEVAPAADQSVLPKESDQPLPVVGSYEKLKKLLKDYEKGHGIQYGVAVKEAMEAVPAMEGAPVLKAKTAAAPTPDSSSYSSTNVQVQGVDEADIVKTDGTYLYQATPEEVRIIRAKPATSMELVSRLSFSGDEFSPQDMYIDEKRLIVIGQSHPKAVRDHIITNEKRFMHGHSNTMVQALIYDISDKHSPRLTRALEADGYYVSSRKIGSSFYLVTNKGIDWYALSNQSQEVPGPRYRDTAQGDDYKTIGYSAIRYFPEAIQPGYLIVAGANLDNPKQAASIHTYLGSGENVYASPNNLYVAVTQQEVESAGKAKKSLIAGGPVPIMKSETSLYRFSMKNGNLAYTGKGTVPGRMLNQFSLDEHNGYLRIATTTGDMWRTDENTSKNNLYVLDSQLQAIGKLEGIAPGERIYSVRFMGDRAYMVTFKQVDPLFVIDVKQPDSPKILGALKIPGYSDYLHPYDENHIIGFGKDAVADKETAFYQGMKLALFDVTDVSKPVEKFQTVIGDRGTDSELLYDHKALLFSKEKQLLAFPVSVHELTAEQKAEKDIRAYGSFSFQGAYVYGLNEQDGFVLRGTITHLNSDDMKKAGQDWYDSAKNVERIVYIGDTLYTISRDQVKANSLQTLTETNTLMLSK
ncbi:beta-propeller domain-containing protein [Brevibacillus borstelensis]|uniref:beta-propeller domain-containing protein n=1 Tax=Brevibacillus borstelensis TaxID=45462 RepID=UPI00046A6052|nr:beta-propeller domain-containing protein [Brevibacillus borstelensis]